MNFAELLKETPNPRCFDCYTQIAFNNPVSSSHLALIYHNNECGTMPCFNPTEFEDLLDQGPGWVV